ncbi:MAG: glycosyl hydrolase family 18 protein [Catonella sp.]|nr:glycosyl hydrolase family 18 protein [Catonella sp.]MDY6355942.1 glycosyl hydrolase family 18 protein [Catonella sp.]
MDNNENYKNEGRNQFNRKVILLIALLVCLLCVIVLVKVIEHFTPSKEVKKLTDYYSLAGNEAELFIDTKNSGEKGAVIDGKGYILLSTAQNMLPRLYADKTASEVIFTTPTEVEEYPLNSTEYTVNSDEKKSLEVPAVIVGDNGSWYISTDFIKSKHDMSVNVSADPGRIVLFEKNGAEYDVHTVKEDTQVRDDATIKGNVLSDVKKGDRLYLLGGAADSKFVNVLTEDGVTGYCLLSKLGESELYKTDFKREKDSEIYTSVKRDGKVVLGWHQVTNEAANSTLDSVISGNGTLNVISPTWFSVVQNDGTLSTLADENYVKTVHDAGMQIWPLVNDFDKNVDFAGIFASRVKRNGLILNIMYFINKYDLDGINIDFENITSEDSADYTEFIRELSVSMRKAGKTLSVDTYVPTEYTAYYDRTEIGTVADFLIIMAYDEHYSGSSTPGSVSSVSWVKNGIDSTLELIPEEKMIVGLPFYTRIWRTAPDGTLTSRALSMDGGLARVKEGGATPKWSKKYGQYIAKWMDGDDTMRIWLEEEKSIGTKIKAIDTKAPNCGGVAFWKLGLERPEVWENVSAWSR